jgi:NAD(P)-dependent dehydrogenase (short-subunit alcohol dehydrogenase family)
MLLAGLVFWYRVLVVVPWCLGVTPEDVARCIVAICHPATYWMTGNTLHVDGGESIVG